MVRQFRLRHPDGNSNQSFDSLLRRIFLDSCTAQMLRAYGYIYEGELISEFNRIYRVTDGIANVEALQNIFLVNERAQFERIVSRGSISEAFDNGGPAHLQWFWDIVDHSNVCLHAASSLFFFFFHFLYFYIFLFD